MHPPHVPKAHRVFSDLIFQKLHLRRTCMGRLIKSAETKSRGRLARRVQGFDAVVVAACMTATNQRLITIKLINPGVTACAWAASAKASTFHSDCRLYLTRS